ncbi:CoA pyrophosphatase [Marinibacterium profundimaris]|uniref:CoA pyrophosphatase n=1 Tax=Marinibacterium profundimaris TaxID=1679460 RepID=UPI000B51ED72|nr:CoA pyrophosphatase [Marinibacterium profundimaris]
MSAPGALEHRIVRALGRAGDRSSDFDLNPEVKLPPGRKLRPAGVLLGIDVTGTAPRVLLTKRSSALKHHPGQIAFPGGKQDEGDADVIDAALREAEEEVALPRDAVRVLGTMPAHETVTSFLVTPVVALIETPFTIRPEPGEVEEAFAVPLDHLLEPAHYSVQSRRWRGSQRHYFTVPYGPYYIWGATARMLRAFAERMRA